MVNIEVNPVLPLEKWNLYVDSHPKGKFCHLPVWRSVIQESFHHKPYYLFALEGARNIRGMMPLFLIKSALKGNYLVSFPFFSSSGPIADSPEITSRLADAAVDLSRKLGCNYLELRMDEELGSALSVDNYYSTFVLEITEPDVLWKKLHQKSTRWAIGKARKEGVTVKRGAGSDDLRYFYAINFTTKKRIGIPCHPYRFFSDIFAKLPLNADLYIARVNHIPIAGIICFKYKNTIEYAYAASDPRYLHFHPNHLLVWQAILDGCREGYRYFDFGRTSPENEGLYRFKKHWGGARKQLCYYYYPEPPRLLSTRNNGIKSRLRTRVWQNLPVTATRALNPLACRLLD